MLLEFVIPSSQILIDIFLTSNIPLKSELSASQNKLYLLNFLGIFNDFWTSNLIDAKEKSYASSSI